MYQGGGGGGFQRRPRGPAQLDSEFAPQKRHRGQRPVDYFGGALRLLTAGPYVRSCGGAAMLAQVPPHEYYAKDLVPASATPHNPSMSLCTQWVHSASYPETMRFADRAPLRKRPYFVRAVWSPSGRRLLCATSNGEFIVYNGQSFGVEHKTTAHEDGKMCRALAWSGLTDSVVSGDEGGTVKLWANNFQLAAEFDSNQRAVRSADWAPSEKRFCTAGQDGSVRVWDTERVATSGGTPDVETKLEGHGGDVQAVKWHPSKALIASGSQDRCVRLWDPRVHANENQLSILQGHIEPVMSIQWHPCGHEWQLLSGGRDSTARLWDVRMMSMLCTFTAHTADVNDVAWHPTVPNLFASAGADGTLAYWTVPATAGSSHEVVGKYTAAVFSAHDQSRDRPNPIGGCTWSPLGHIMVTFASELHVWARNKPGAVEEMRYEADDAADLVMPTVAAAGTILSSWAA